MVSSREEDEDDDEISSSHSSSSSSSYSSSDASSSSSDGSSRQRRRWRHQRTIHHEKEEDYFFRFSSLLRHRRTKSTTMSVDADEEYYYDSSSSKNKKRRKVRIRATQRDGTTRREFHWSSRLLGFSLLVWSGVQIATTEYMQHQQSLWYIGNVNNIDQTQERRRQQSQQQQYDDQYGNNNNNSHHRSSPGHPNNRHSNPHRPPRPLMKNKKKGSEKEKLESGCELDPTWQTPDSNSRLLSCQILHELDLTEALASSGSSSSGSSKRRRSISSSAHLGSGLWRDVWKVRDNYIHESNHDLNTKYVVLKTMKSEHEVIPRNLERHRREASSLNTLTSSQYVTDLYGYCGNSILTEFATQDLSHALNKNNKINDSERRRKIKDANRVVRANEYKESLHHNIYDNNYNSTDTIDDKKESDDDNKESDSTNNSNGIPKFSAMASSSSSPLSLTRRLDWALQVSKAVADLHRSDIIHADITSKQFLVNWDNDSNETAQIKINDFNRCRFVPRRQQNHTASTAMNSTSTINIDTAMNSTTTMNSTWSKRTDICKIRIPSAPGKYRSPEEYSDKPLTTQMDVYSLGHVLYEIWTSGQNPWNDVGAKRIKNMVMDGSLPVELKKIEDDDVDASVEKKSFEADDRAFGLLIRECYRVDPERRITAEGLVEELTKLLAREYRRKNK
jgi:serine/threonine protein kinase